MGLEPESNVTMNAIAHTNSAAPSRPKTAQYKGHPMIILNPDDRFPFQFGLHKAKLILQHYEDIRKFVEDAEHASAPAAA
jgi:hypothetical protein